MLPLLGRDPDPAKSREHVLLSVLAERRLLAAQTADLASLLDDLAQPPIEESGALELNDFLRKSERKALSAALNTLLASPTWRQGAVVDGLSDVAPDAVMSDVANVIKKLAPRWFLLRVDHAREGMMLLQPRWAMTLMLGPMTRTEIRRARELAKASTGGNEDDTDSGEREIAPPASEKRQNNEDQHSIRCDVMTRAGLSSVLRPCCRCKSGRVLRGGGAKTGRIQCEVLGSDLQLDRNPSATGVFHRA